MAHTSLNHKSSVEVHRQAEENYIWQSPIFFCLPVFGLCTQPPKNKFRLSPCYALLSSVHEYVSVELTENIFYALQENSFLIRLNNPRYVSIANLCSDASIKDTVLRTSRKIELRRVILSGEFLIFMTRLGASL